MGSDCERDVASATGSLSASGALCSGQYEGGQAQSSVDTHAPPGAGGAAARRANSSVAGVYCVYCVYCVCVCVCAHACARARSSTTHMHTRMFVVCYFDVRSNALATCALTRAHTRVCVCVCVQVTAQCPRGGALNPKP